MHVTQSGRVARDEPAALAIGLAGRALCGLRDPRCLCLPHGALRVVGQRAVPREGLDARVTQRAHERDVRGAQRAVKPRNLQHAHIGEWQTLRQEEEQLGRPRRVCQYRGVQLGARACKRRLHRGLGRVQVHLGLTSLLSHPYW